MGAHAKQGAPCSVDNDSVAFAAGNPQRGLRVVRFGRYRDSDRMPPAIAIILRSPMPKNRLALGAVLAALALAFGLLAPAATADAPHLPNASIKASDYRVSSGEQFIVRGRVTLGYGRNKIAAPPSIVRVQTKLHGSWNNLRGARVRSNGNGRYRVRVVLGMEGKRRLRVRVKTPKFRKSVKSRVIKVRVR